MATSTKAIPITAQSAPLVASGRPDPSASDAVPTSAEAGAPRPRLHPLPPRARRRAGARRPRCPCSQGSSEPVDCRQRTRTPLLLGSGRRSASALCAACGAGTLCSAAAGLEHQVQDTTALRAKANHYRRFRRRGLAAARREWALMAPTTSASSTAPADPNPGGPTWTAPPQRRPTLPTTHQPPRPRRSQSPDRHLPPPRAPHPTQLVPPQPARSPTPQRAPSPPHRSVNSALPCSRYRDSLLGTESPK
jgi:hypothetical protein